MTTQPIPPYANGSAEQEAKREAYYQQASEKFEAALPYAGTSGYSGTDTSEERARTEDSTGVTGARQQRVISALRVRGATGVTVVDMRRIFSWHHGQASSALTNLHKAGKIVRLAEKRDRCKVYVLPEHTEGRPTEEMGHNKQFAAGYTAAIDAIYEAVRSGVAPMDALDRVASESPRKRSEDGQ